MQVYENGTFFEVPYIFQEHVNLCTDASMHMLYNVGKKPLASMAKNPRGVFEGRDYDDSPDFKKGSIILQDFVDGKVEDIDSQKQRITEAFEEKLKTSGPFIFNIGLRFGERHSVLTTGISGDMVIYNDPLTGPNRAISVGDLIQLYGSRDAPYIETATANFLQSEDLQKIQTEKLTVVVERVEDTRDKKHFTLKKMESPSQALLNFLQHIVKKDKCSGDESQKLQRFLDTHSKADEVTSMMAELDEIFPEVGQSEKLSRYLSSAEHYMNVPSDPEDEDFLFCGDLDIPPVTGRKVGFEMSREAMRGLREDPHSLDLELPSFEEPETEDMETFLIKKN